MDWSLFKPHAQYPLLRPKLIYKSQIPVRSPLVDLLDATDDVLALLLCFGTLADSSHLASDFDILSAGVQSMHSFHLAYLFIRR